VIVNGASRSSVTGRASWQEGRAVVVWDACGPARREAAKPGRGDRNDRRRHRESAREEAFVAINSEEIAGLL